MSGRDIYLAKKKEARRLYDEMIKLRDTSGLPKWKLHSRLQQFINELRELGYTVKLDNKTFAVKEVKEEPNLELKYRFTYLLGLKSKHGYASDKEILTALIKRKIHQGTCQKCKGSGYITLSSGAPSPCAGFRGGDGCIDGIVPPKLNKATFDDLCRRMS